MFHDAKKKNLKTNEGKNANHAVLSFTLAAVIGGALGVLFAPKKGEKMREDILNQAKVLAKDFDENRSEVQAKLKKIFGEVNEDLEKAYIEVKANILGSLEAMKGNLEFSQEHYEETVERAVRKIFKGKKWLEKSVVALIKNLKEEQPFLKYLQKQTSHQTKTLKKIAKKVQNKTKSVKKTTKKPATPSKLAKRKPQKKTVNKKKK